VKSCLSGRPCRGSPVTGSIRSISRYTWASPSTFFARK
jgi:hypothetical protein